MGNLVTKENKIELSITTLNYSGILNSPFEFYSAELQNQEKLLNQIFDDLLKQQFKDYKSQTFKWGLGKIDQKMQKQRYTPLYHAKCGLTTQGLITSLQDFSKLWNKQFQINSPKIQGFQYAQQQKQRALLFDWLCYKTILIFVYECKDLLLIDNTKTQKYKQFMNKFFSKAFLNQQIKIQKTLKAIQKQQTDIMFLQQANQKLIDSIDTKMYKVVSTPKCQSIILIKKSKFKTIYNEKQILNSLGQELKNSFNWNNDTTIAFVDSLILISGHLSSKKQKNVKQLQQMLQSLKRLKNIFPTRQIVVGCDANTFIKNIPNQFYIYPNQPSITTTLKMRTLLQPQVSKANIVAHECRDHLISTIQLNKPRVVSILGLQSQKVGYLPCQSHPYDHFVVSAYVNPK